MASREEVLMATKAPTPEGIDAKQVLQAMAQASLAQGPIHSWGYGMRVADAQQEGALSKRHQAERFSQVQDQMKLAMAQDNELFNRAMQAHAKVMDEKRYALSAEAHALEKQYKQAMLAGVPYQIEEAKARASLAMRQAENAKAMDALRVKISHPDGSFQEVPLGVAASLPYAMQDRLGIGRDKSMQNRQKRTEWYSKAGFSPEDAEVLSYREDIGKDFLAIQRALTNMEKALPSIAGMPSYPANADGSPGTRESWEAAVKAQLLNTHFMGLSKEGMDLLQKKFGGDLGALTAPDTSAKEAQIRRFLEEFSSLQQQ